MTFNCLICGEELDLGEVCASSAGGVQVGVLIHQQAHLDARIEIYGQRMILDLTGGVPRFLLTSEGA